jgi:hypothetical protein
MPELSKKRDKGCWVGALFIVKRDSPIAIDDKARLGGINSEFGAPEGQKIPTERTLDQPCDFGRPANAILNSRIARSVLEHREIKSPFQNRS